MKIRNIHISILSFLFILATMLSAAITLSFAENEEPSLKEKKSQEGYVLNLKDLIKRSKKKIDKVNEKLDEQAKKRRNQQREEKSREYYQKATLLFEEGQYEEARQMLEKAIKITEHPEMMDYIAENALKMKKEDKALKKAEERRLQRLEIERGFSAKKVEKVYQEAIALYKKKKYLPAKDKFEEVDDMFPDHKATRSYLLLINQDIEQEQQAMIEKAARETEVSRKKEKEEWRKELEQREKERSLKLKEQADALYKEAIRLYKQKQYSDAKVKFKEVEWILPNYKSTVKYLKRLQKKPLDEDLVRENKMPKHFTAQSHNEKVTQQNSEEMKQKMLEFEEKENQKRLKEEAEFVYKIAINLYKKKEYAQAQRRFDEVQLLYPDYRSTQKYLNLIEKQIGRRTVQPTYSQKSLIKQGSDSVVQQAVAQRQKQFSEKAERKYQEALSFYRGKNFREAKRKFIEVEALYPRYKDTLHYLGHIDEDIEKYQPEFGVGNGSDSKIARKQKRSTKKVVVKKKRMRSSMKEKSLAPVVGSLDASNQKEQEEIYQQARMFYKSKDYVVAKEKFNQIHPASRRYKSSQKYLSRVNKKIEEKRAHLETEKIKRFRIEQKSVNRKFKEDAEIVENAKEAVQRDMRDDARIAELKAKDAHEEYLKKQDYEEYKDKLEQKRKARKKVEEDRRKLEKRRVKEMKKEFQREENVKEREKREKIRQEAAREREEKRKQKERLAQLKKEEQEAKEAEEAARQEAERLAKKVEAEEKAMREKEKEDAARILEESFPTDTKVLASYEYNHAKEGYDKKKKKKDLKKRRKEIRKTLAKQKKAQDKKWLGDIEAIYKEATDLYKESRYRAAKAKFDMVEGMHPGYRSAKKYIEKSNKMLMKQKQKRRNEIKKQKHLEAEMEAREKLEEEKKVLEDARLAEKKKAQEEDKALKIAKQEAKLKNQEELKAAEVAKKEAKLRAEEEAQALKEEKHQAKIKAKEKRKAAKEAKLKAKLQAEKELRAAKEEKLKLKLEAKKKAQEEKQLAKEAKLAKKQKAKEEKLARKKEKEQLERERERLEGERKRLAKEREMFKKQMKEQKSLDGNKEEKSVPFVKEEKKNVMETKKDAKEKKKLAKEKKKRTKEEKKLLKELEKNRKENERLRMANEKLRKDRYLKAEPVDYKVKAQLARMERLRLEKENEKLLQKQKMLEEKEAKQKAARAKKETERKTKEEAKLEALKEKEEAKAEAQKAKEEIRKAKEEARKVKEAEKKAREEEKKKVAEEKRQKYLKEVEVKKLKRETNKAFRSALASYRVSADNHPDENMKNFERLLTEEALPLEYVQLMRKKMDKESGKITKMHEREQLRREEMARKREIELNREEYEEEKRREKELAALEAKVKREEERLAKEKEQEEKRLLRAKKRKEELTRQEKEREHQRKLNELRKQSERRLAAAKDAIDESSLTDPVLTIDDVKINTKRKELELERKKREALVKKREKQLDALVRDQERSLASQREKIRLELNRTLEELYQRAVKLYKSGSAVSAKQMFVEIESMSPNYKKSRKYLTLIEKKLRENPQVKVEGAVGFQMDPLVGDSYTVAPEFGIKERSVIISDTLDLIEQGM